MTGEYERSSGGQGVADIKGESAGMRSWRPLLHDES